MLYFILFPLLHSSEVYTSHSQKIMEEKSCCFGATTELPLGSKEVINHDRIILSSNSSSFKHFQVSELCTKNDDL